MKNLFNQSDVSEILARLDKLTPTSQSQWGKMNVGQMLAHLNAALETAMGLNKPKRLLIGRVLGSFVKPNYLSEKPLGKNAPTDKFYIFTDNRNFEKEKAKTIELVKQFFEGGESKCTTNPHSFFGKLTSDEWALSQWKHFDHHLRQFDC
ncbi:MAG: DUF1569 domain-containing protein [Ferruginibacter sp.]